MANKASNYLHELIHSMSGAEKRYFKLFADRHHSRSPKNYVILFDAIDAQPEYDEADLREQFSGEPFLNYLSIAKNRLYNQVLQSLDAFHASRSVEAELCRRLHHAEILFSKALYDQSRKVLGSVEKAALENERWEVYLLALRRRKRLTEVALYEGRSDEVSDIVKPERQALSALDTEAGLWAAKSRIQRALFVSGQARQDRDLSVLKREVERAEELYASTEPTYEARYLILQARSAYRFASGEYDLCHEALSENRNHLEAHPARLEEDPGAYFAVLTNLIYVSAKLNKLEVAEEALRRSRNLPARLVRNLTPDLKLRIFINTYSLELAIANLSGQVERAQALIDEVQKGLEKWGDRIGTAHRAALLHGMSTLCYMIDDRKSALALNNELLNTIAIDKTEDSYVFAQIFHLLLHYEAGNFDLIAYGLKSLRRLFDAREKHFAFEDCFAKFLKAAIRADTTSDRQAAAADFLRDILRLEHEKFEKTVFEYFDFIAWAEAQSGTDSFRERVIRRAPLKDIL